MAIEPEELVAKLRGTDRRSIGRSEEVVSDVLQDPSLFGVLIEATLGDDPVVRLRAADAAEKITRHRPGLLMAHKRRLLREVAAVQQKEVRWHVAQMLPRLTLTPRERAAATRLLVDYLDDDSRIVQTCALQGLVDLARVDERLQLRIRPMVERLATTGSPAVRSRARKLVHELGRGRSDRK
jgi:HEAT repeat protein